MSSLFSARDLVVFGLIGIGFFAASVFLMVFLFGWSLRETRQKTKEVAFLFLVSFSIPLTMGSLSRKTNLFSQAAVDVEITSFEKVSLEDGTGLVNLTTSQPVIVFLECEDALSGEVKPILPTYSLEERTDHSFLINNGCSVKTRPTVVINGEKFIIKQQSMRLLPDGHS